MSDRERIRLLERDLRGAMAIIEREGNRNDELNRLRALLLEAREAIRTMDESLDGEFSTGLLYEKLIERIDLALEAKP